ncbi:MAG TPA: AMP-binding protein [Planctomycetota bacterium]|nr:AMP-binding protein [Planctomycetota bacterium]
MFDWLHLGIERCIRSSPPLHKHIASFSPVWYVRRLGELKLVRTLRHVWRNCPTQRQRWADAGITLADIRSSDVLRHLPFTTGSDLAEHPEDYCCVPRDRLVHVFATSGTTGTAKRIYLTDEDLHRQTRMVGTHLSRFRGSTRVMIMMVMRNTSWSARAVAIRAYRKARIHVHVVEPELDIGAQIDRIRRHRINTLLSGPAHVHRFLFEADVDLRTLGVRYLHVAGQPFTETFRTQLEDAWGAKVIDTYGMAECAYGVASECRLQDGLHFTNIDFHLEIVDPKTDELLPDGREGEVVLTTLSRRGMPLVRYRTRDLASLRPERRRCACGLPLRKMSRVRGRVDDVLFMAGTNVYPDEFDRALLSIAGVTDYQVVVDKDRYKDRLNVRIETDLAGQELRDTITNALRTIPYVRLLQDRGQVLAIGKIESVPRGSLTEGRLKSVRIVDNRPESTT